MQLVITINIRTFRCPQASSPSSIHMRLASRSSLALRSRSRSSIIVDAEIILVHVTAS